MKMSMKYFSIVRVKETQHSWSTAFYYIMFPSWNIYKHKKVDKDTRVGKLQSIQYPPNPWSRIIKQVYFRNIKNSRMKWRCQVILKLWLSK